MKALFRAALLAASIAVAALGMSLPAFSGETQVKGYVKADGTYVAPHMRTTPNSTKLDNWSAKGNVNPYTGEAGTKDPSKPAK